MKINRFKLKKIPIQKINSFIKENYLKIGAVIFVLLIAANICVFFKYIYLPTSRVKVSSEIEQTKINESLLEEVLGDIEVRENNLKRVEGTNYRDPFR